MEKKSRHQRNRQMDHEYLNTKFKAEWQIKRINECQRGIFQGFFVPNEARKEVIINLSKLYRIHLKEKEDRINYLSDSEDQNAIYEEFREWFEDPGCEILTSRTEYMNLTHSDHTKEIQSKTYFARFRFCYNDDDYYKCYEPFLIRKIINYLLLIPM